MTEPTHSPVRPTKRCLQDLELIFPPLEQSLEAIQHPVIARAQQVPHEVVAHGAERIRAIRDLVWFKVKTGTYRGAVVQLNHAMEYRPEILEAGTWWWIGAAGRRQQDSDADFYRSLTREVQREGKGTGTTSSAHLLPADVDIRRLRAELAVRVTLQIRQVVRKLIAGSIQNGKTWIATLSGHKISALVRAKDGEAYLAVAAEGFMDPKMLAIILNAVPHLDADDWLPEPEGIFGIVPQPAQIIFSAIISAATQTAIMDEFSDDQALGL
ncbi:hypothetical protein [Micromonospora sp. NBC_01796]|uniref:hypothetical protein n=1 Tax=Micromonospora sp. NBC_01796 TaxID=2975987 RepID=UPI002DDBB357|nr:hypothetical protein [Micromonospora sp. NBC_01796]WSA87959.1 hypothetical protein OIE47_10310 [Micromonospora sp. NBC_01796]